MKIGIKILSFCLTVAMVFLSTPQAFLIETDAVDSMEDGYVPISTTADLYHVREDLSGKYYLTNDIVFSAEDFAPGGDYYNDGKGWEPIYNFRGILDGNGYSICGLQIVRKLANYDRNKYFGLFSKTDGATIQNLTMKDGVIRVFRSTSVLMCQAYAASFCGESINTTYINCHNYNTVYTSNAGGLVATCDGGVFQNCTNRGDILLENGAYGSYHGGLIACIVGGTVTISNCSNFGTVTGGDCDCGGIAGGSYNATIRVENCLNVGAIGCAESDSSGGIFASKSGEGSVVITGCYNTASVIGSHAGGILGWDFDANAYAYDCYNTGNVTCHGTYVNAGGIFAKKGRAYRCYNIGAVTSTRYTEKKLAPICADNGYASNCYAIVSATYNKTDGATLCTANELKKQYTYKSFDFNEIWSISPDMNGGYPYLRKTLLKIDLENVQIKLYSELPSMTIGKGRAVGAAIQLESCGQVLFGSMMYEEFSFSIQSSNESVLQIGEQQQADDGVHFSILGVAPGDATLLISEARTGATYQTEVHVSNGIITFNADALPAYYERDKEYNGYIEGMYIDNFQKTLEVDQYSVTFDVYNTSNLTGMVQVYDAAGNLKDIVPIARFADVNITSIKDTLVSSWHVISDLVTGDLATYKSNLVSVCTPVAVRVPLGGKIELTNNPQYSAACALYNGIDFLVETVILFSDFATNMPDGLRETYGDNVAARVVEDFFDAVKGDLTKEKVQKLAKKLQEEFGKNAMKKISMKSAVVTIQAWVDEAKSSLVDLGIDLVGIMLASAAEMGFAVGQDGLLKAMGPAGMSLTAMFEFAKCMNFLSFFVSLSGSSHYHAFVVQFNGRNGALCDNGAALVTDNPIGNQNSVFTAEIVRAKELDALMRETFEQAIRTTKYSVMTTTLQKDGEPQEIEGEVTLRLPIPVGSVSERCLVYEVGDGGVLSPIEATVEDGYGVFTVRQLGQYVVVEAPLCGDADGDNSVTNADALCLFRYIYDATAYPLDVAGAADVNGDGLITNADVLCVFRYIYDPVQYPFE